MTAQRARWSPDADPDSGDHPAISPEPTLRHILGRIDRMLRSELDVRLDDLGLTTRSYTMLFILRRLPGLSNADLARWAGVSPQASNLTVLELTERGLLRRRPSKENNRILRNELTARGRRLIERCETEATAIEASLLHDFTAREREQFLGFLRRGATNLGIDIEASSGLPTDRPAD
jgi:DNA-binding MarR family transcriptional regulator